MNFSKHFEKRTKHNGQSFFIVSSFAPEPLKRLLHDVHKQLFNDCWPHDWIYEQVFHAFIDLENDKLDNINIEPDIYYHALYNWLHLPNAHDYCDVAIEEGFTDGKTLISILQEGNKMCKFDIYNKVNDFLESQKELV